MYSILGDRYRRLVLRSFESGADETTRDVLAREIARETGQSESTERILALLHHVHLPKLADENAIRYEPDDGVVATTGQTERFLAYLDQMESV